MNNIFCPNCGAQITSEETITQNVCPLCGSLIENISDISPTETMGFIEAYKNMFKKFIQFNGRSSRREYWNAATCNFFINLIIMLIICVAEYQMFELAMISSIVLFAYQIVIIIPVLAMFVRRIHDVGKSGLWVFSFFIPYIGTFILLYFILKDSQPGANKYGANPKEKMIQTTESHTDENESSEIYLQMDTADGNLARVPMSQLEQWKKGQEELDKEQNL